VTPATRPEVVAAIAGFSPRTVAPEAAAFARGVVAAAAPQSPARARALLFACSKLGAFGLAVGLELRPQVMLCPSVIERFIISGTSAMSGPTRRTLRTNLRHVAARATGGGPAPVALPRERVKAPYSDAEIAAYLGLADAQPTAARLSCLLAVAPADRTADQRRNQHEPRGWADAPSSGRDDCPTQM